MGLKNTFSLPLQAVRQIAGLPVSDATDLPSIDLSQNARMLITICKNEISDLSQGELQISPFAVNGFQFVPKGTQSESPAVKSIRVAQGSDIKLAAVIVEYTNGIWTVEEHLYDRSSSLPQEIITTLDNRQFQLSTRYKILGNLNRITSNPSSFVLSGAEDSKLEVDLVTDNADILEFFGERSDHLVAARIGVPLELGFIEHSIQSSGAEMGTDTMTLVKVTFKEI